MLEIVFLVEQAPEGGFTAHVLGECIFTEASTKVELFVAIQDAVHCHFGKDHLPKAIRLHFLHNQLQRQFM